MANENNNKIPCGGFYLGDGLTMDGNTLKSLGGKQIQTDWNQNNTTAKDYIKNRPGGYEENKEITLIFNPDDAHEVYAGTLQKVSNTPMSIDEILASNILITADGKTLDAFVSEENIKEHVVGCYNVEAYSTDGNMCQFLSVYKPQTTDSFGADVPIGVYVVYQDANTKTYVNQIAYTKSIIHPINSKYIPEMGSITLLSSTADSTKKFKITVDDNGAISATEITE